MTKPKPELRLDDDSITDSVERRGGAGEIGSPSSPSHGPLSPDLHSLHEDSSSIIDYNQVFNKQERESEKSILKEMSKKRFSVQEMQQEEKRQQLTYHEQLKQHYSTDYASFKTPIIAFFYFFQFTTKQSRQIIDLFDGCDNKRRHEVELKEFGLRYCSSQKMMFFILYYFYSLVFQGQYIHPNDGKLVKEDGSREDAPGRNSFRRQQSMKQNTRNASESSEGPDNSQRPSLTQNNPYHPADGQSTPFFHLIAFLTHFLSLRPNDYVLYFHWLLTYGNKTSLNKRDLTSIILLLQREQQMNRETVAKNNPSVLQILSKGIASLRPKTAGELLAQYGFSSKKKKAQPSSAAAASPSSSKGKASNQKLTNTYLDTIKDDNISTGLLRVIDTKMKGIISTSMTRLRRFLIQQTYSEKTFWSDVLTKMRSILYEQNILDYYHKTVKHMQAEEVDLCYDFRIMKHRKSSERLIRKCIRYWQRYQQMVQLEAQSLSDLSGFGKPSFYSKYCTPIFRLVSGGGGSGSSKSGKVHPEFHIENIQQLSILQGAEISGALIGRRGSRRGSISVGEVVRKLSVMLMPPRRASKGRYAANNAQQPKISFKELTAKPVVPSNKELQTTTVKVKKKAFEAIDEVERLLEEAKDPVGASSRSKSEGVKTVMAEDSEEEDDDHSRGSRSSESGSEDEGGEEEEGKEKKVLMITNDGKAEEAESPEKSIDRESVDEAPAAVVPFNENDTKDNAATNS